MTQILNNYFIMIRKEEKKRIAAPSFPHVARLNLFQNVKF